jgi:hypothetical protein
MGMGLERGPRGAWSPTLVVVSATVELSMAKTLLVVADT